MLELKNLHAGYGQMKVLHGINLTIGEGEIVALLGSNGAGKSTLNNNVSGVFKPKDGQILFEGQDITGLASELVVDLGIVQVPEGRRILRAATWLGVDLQAERKAKSGQEKKPDPVKTINALVDKLGGVQLSERKQVSGERVRLYGWQLPH